MKKGALLFEPIPEAVLREKLAATQTAGSGQILAVKPAYKLLRKFNPGVPEKTWARLLFANHILTKGFVPAKEDGTDSKHLICFLLPNEALEQAKQRLSSWIQSNYKENLAAEKQRQFLKLVEEAPLKHRETILNSVRLDNAVQTQQARITELVTTRVKLELQGVEATNQYEAQVASLKASIGYWSLEILYAHLEEKLKQTEQTIKYNADLYADYNRVLEPGKQKKSNSLSLSNLPFRHVPNNAVTRLKVGTPGIGFSPLMRVLRSRPATVLNDYYGYLHQPEIKLDLQSKLPIQLSQEINDVKMQMREVEKNLQALQPQLETTLATPNKEYQLLQKKINLKIARIEKRLENEKIKMQELITNTKKEATWQLALLLSNDATMNF